jgi:hypothetical protein
MRFQPLGLHGMFNKDSAFWSFLMKIKSNLNKTTQRS